MSEVKVDTISERTAANGVAVDGVTIKDSGLTIPSGGTLTVASGATIANSGTATGFGKVVQVVTSTYSTTESISNTTWADTSHTLTANITSASNKVIVLVSTTARIYRAAIDDTQGFWRIQNTTDASTLTETMLWYGSNTSWDKKFAVANTLVGVETGISGSKTYTVQFKSDSTGGTTFYLNYANYTGCMILLEVE